MNGLDIIEDIFIPSSNQQGGPVAHLNHFAESHPAYGMQLPQPLKQTFSLNTSYQAPTKTLNAFNHYGDQSIQSSAVQSSAIRGRVTSPHVYQWDAMQPTSKQEEKPKDYGMYSGMRMPQTNTATQFSQSLDPKQMIREAIFNLFNNAQMIKTHQQGLYSIFKCPVENLTGGNYKFIVAIVPNFDHIPLGASHSLRSLPWISFQTRQTENPVAEFGTQRPQPITYIIPMDSKHPLYTKINRVLEDQTKHTYLNSALGCKIDLLKQKEGDMAAESSTILSALEAYRTVITL